MSLSCPGSLARSERTGTSTTTPRTPRDCTSAVRSRTLAGRGVPGATRNASPSESVRLLQARSVDVPSIHIWLPTPSTTGQHSAIAPGSTAGAIPGVAARTHTHHTRVARGAPCPAPPAPPPPPPRGPPHPHGRPPRPLHEILGSLPPSSSATT